MEIKSFIGRKFDNPNEIWKDLRRQIEIDRYLKNQKDVKLTYEYYSRPKNPIDFLSKRYVLYPYYGCLKKKDSNKNTVYQIHFQFAADLALFLDKNKTIITCHDIYNFLKRSMIKNSIFTQKYSLMGLKRCRYIVAISEFTKNELVEKLKIPKDKIIVIKSAVNQKMFNVIPENEISKIEPLYPDYKKIFYIGNESQRKNFITLLKAFYLVKKKYKKIKLIRVGTPLYLDYINKLGLTKDIVYLKNVSNERLKEIHNLSDFYVFPSLYEGFGFPGLEAASCGTPVICSNIPVLKEIYEDFPLYFPPKDYKALAKLIIDNLDDEELKKEMILKGFNVVKNLSWKKTANKYLNLVKYISE